MVKKTSGTFEENAEAFVKQIVESQKRWKIIQEAVIPKVTRTLLSSIGEKVYISSFSPEGLAETLQQIARSEIGESLSPDEVKSATSEVDAVLNELAEEKGVKDLRRQVVTPTPPEKPSTTEVAAEIEAKAPDPTPKKKGAKVSPLMAAAAPAPETPPVPEGPPKKVQKGLNAGDRARQRKADKVIFAAAKGRKDEVPTFSKGGPLAKRGETEAAEAALKGAHKKGFLLEFLRRGQVPLAEGAGALQPGGPRPSGLIPHPTMSSAAKAAREALQGGGPLATIPKPAGAAAGVTEKKGLLSRLFGVARKHPVRTGLAALDLLFMPDMIREATGYNRKLEEKRGLAEAMMVRLQGPSVEEVKAQQEVEELVTRRQRLIETGDPGLGNLLMGLPETTRSEIIIGGSPPNREQFRETLRQDAARDGTADAFAY